MLRIFVSYSTHDLWAAQTIRHALLDRPGIGVFFADESVHIGDDLPEKILHNLSICDVFLLLHSKSAAQSSWVNAEVGAAWRQQSRIIPVHLEPDVPLPGPLAGRTTKDIELYKEPNVALARLADAMHGLADEKKRGKKWGWGVAGLILGALLFGRGEDDEDQDEGW